MKTSQWHMDDIRILSGAEPMYTAEDRARIEGMAIEMLSTLMESTLYLKKAAARGEIGPFGINEEQEMVDRITEIVNRAFPGLVRVAP